MGAVVIGLEAEAVGFGGEELEGEFEGFDLGIFGDHNEGRD